MAKDRPDNSKERRLVLDEYDNCCSVCGRSGNGLRGRGLHCHHIDEDTENNDPMNLLPLCPNCHLMDTHNPTRFIEAEILRLFRQYKDPAILTPQFRPIFKRMRFLDDIPDYSEVSERNRANEIGKYACLWDPRHSPDDIGPVEHEKAEDLIKFVACLPQGAYFKECIEGLVTSICERAFSTSQPGLATYDCNPGGVERAWEAEQRRLKDADRFMESLKYLRQRVHDVIINDIIPYQNWPLPQQRF
jgi:Predicted restriction endonuclease